MERFWLAFIPLFVAFDAIGLLPIYWGLAQGLSKAKRRQAVNWAVLVAFGAAVVFLLISQALFALLGVQLPDVMIAGGIVLFVLALHDLLSQGQARAGSIEAIGVVPLGVPLIVGPAVLTTILLVRERSGMGLTLASLSLNIVLSWLALRMSDRLIEWLGREGSRVVSKVFSLVLASFAVMLIRHGFTTLFPGAFGRP